MRKVILAMNVSLDGFIEGPNGELDWFIFDEEMWKEVNDQVRSIGTLLFGRVAYPGFESYWSSAATNPSSTKDEIEFSHNIENIPRIVFSKTLEKVEWKNTRLVKENIAEEILKMKQQPGKDLVIVGGAGIASTFMNLGLIDEYQINVHPIVLGSGKPLFKDIKDRINLKLVKTKTYTSGVVGLHYELDRNNKK